MILEIKLKKDDGTVIHEGLYDAVRPQQYKTHPDKPAVEGNFKLFGWTYQPQVVREMLIVQPTTVVPVETSAVAVYK